jgi:tetratricopeptide (TPR) repeat protein
VDTNSQETVRSYLQLQEQLHATQLAIERTRREADEAAAEMAKAMSGRLQAIEQALSAQRAQELQAMQSSNRVMLIVAGGFAALGLAAMLFMAYFQWRTVNRLAEISAVLPLGHSLVGGSPLPALGDGQTHLLSSGSPEQSNARLLGTIDRLEQRIRELEDTTHHPGNETTAHNDNGNHLGDAATRPSNGEPSPAQPAEAPALSAEADLVSFLLGKGQSLLNLDKSEEAMACFDEILTLHPGHPEALVKKGTALEKLRRLNEAVECYDKAIAADDSMTIAYLCKGGLFNRMERYNEALECYEKALRTQEKRA